MVPFYHRGTIFSLIIMFVEKGNRNSAPRGAKPNYGQPKTPLGVLFWHPYFSECVVYAHHFYVSKSLWFIMDFFSVPWSCAIANRQICNLRKKRYEKKKRKEGKQQTRINWIHIDSTSQIDVKLHSGCWLGIAFNVYVQKYLNLKDIDIWA